MGSTIRKVLVVGSTGATGKHVVRMLLERGDTEVVAVARSKEKLMGLVNPENTNDEKMKNLVVKETTIANIALEELRGLIKECSAVVSCLGHNLDWKGIYRDGYFVKESAEKITSVMPEQQECRFVMMGSDGVAHPDGKTDPKRSRLTRAVIWLLRMLVPPVVDNELAALHLYQHTLQNPSSSCGWTIVRPGDLFDRDDADIYPVVNNKADKQNGYEIFDHPQGSLFGDNSAARSDVAEFMVELVTMEEKAFQKTYNHKMPVIYSKKGEPTVKQEL